MNSSTNNSIVNDQLTITHYRTFNDVIANFTFIDLFAGIGGFRFAFESVGGTCVFSSEYDKYSQITYKTFFGETPDFSYIKKVDPPGDITQIDPQLIPDHDILTGGFPCQPFSLAGVSKKNSLNRQHGFNDPTQGTLFFNIKEIISIKQPKAFILENVKHLLRHDNGKTFSVIYNTLKCLGYQVFYRVIDANGWVPQHRERIFIIGFRDNNHNRNYSINSFPELNSITPPPNGPQLLDILETSVPAKYTLGPGTWSTLLRHRENHIHKGQGFGYSLIEPPFSGKTTRTISARYHKDGAEVLIAQNGSRPRRLTPLECLRLMGFPEHCEKYFNRYNKVKQPVSDTQAYRQFGNAVVVPLVTELAKSIITELTNKGAL